MKMIKEKQKEWAELKYLIMSKSQTSYQQISQLFRDNTWNEEKEQAFRNNIQLALLSKPAKGALVNAYQHVWGYFKTVATQEEKKQYHQLLANFSMEADLLLPFLQSLAEKYQVTYLLESKLLFDKKNYLEGQKNEN